MSQGGNTTLKRCLVSALLASVLVTGASGAPAGAEVRDTSEFACPANLTTPFTDIAGTTHEQSIACAVHYEFTGGTSATTFTPSGTVSRGQMATFIMRFLGFIDVPDGFFAPTEFADIVDSPHATSIEGVVELGIAEDTSRTTFDPNSAVSRAQMATFLRRTADLIGIPPVADAPDAFDDDNGNPHEESIEQIAALGVADGTAPRTYTPSGTVSRGAMASFLARLADVGIETYAFVPNIVSSGLAALDGPAGGDQDGTGTVAIETTDVDGVVCVAIEVEGIAAPTSVVLRQGQASGTTPGPVVATLPPVTVGAVTAGCVHDDAATAIDSDPNGYYVEVQNAEFPTGALRGQLGVPTAAFGADLTDVEVVPGPGDPNALGFVTGITTSQPNTVCISVLALIEEPVTGAHLHSGAAHTDGPEVFPIRAVESAEFFGASERLLFQCIVTSSAAQIAANPSQFHVDVHTATFPDGALRGQLQPESIEAFRSPAAAPLVG